MTLSRTVVTPFSVMFPGINIKIDLIRGAIMAVAAEINGGPITGAGMTVFAGVDGGAQFGRGGVINDG